MTTRNFKAAAHRSQGWWAFEVTGDDLPHPVYTQARRLLVEREIMNRHAARWRPHLERGDMVVFGPILTDDDSYGLAVVETDDEQAVRDFATQDPVVTTGTAAFELGRMAAGHVRGR
jgi:uncharacterized protein YciI